MFNSIVRRSVKSMDLQGPDRATLLCPSDPVEGCVSFAHMRTLTFPGQTVEGVILRLAEELKERGFDIVSRVDLQAALKSTGKEFAKPYLVFGVVHPELCLKALTTEPALGPLLPFSIALTETDSHEMLLQVLRPATLWGSAIPEGKFETTAKIILELDQLLRDTFDTVVRLPLPHPDAEYTWPPVRLPPEAGVFEEASKRAWEQVKSKGNMYKKVDKDLPGEHVKVVDGPRPMSMDAPRTPTNEPV